MLTDYIYSNIIEHIINNILLPSHSSQSENVLPGQPRTRLSIDQSERYSVCLGRGLRSPCQSSMVVKNKHLDIYRQAFLVEFGDRI